MWRGAGLHVLKAGYTLNRIWTDALANTYPDGYVSIFWGRSYPSVSMPGRYRGRYGYYLNRVIGVAGEASSNQHGFFIQDTWRIRRGVDLQVGVRAEREIVPSFGGGRQPIEFPFGAKLAPRLGVAWSPASKGRVRLSGDFGLYYDTIKLALPRAYLGGSQSQWCAYTLESPDLNAIRPNPAPDSMHGAFPGQLIECVDQNPPADNPADLRIDPRLKPMRQRNYSAAIDIASTPAMLGVRYSARRLDRAVEDAGFSPGGADRFYIVNPGEGLATIYPRPVRTYDGLDVVLRSPSSRGLFYQIVYTFSRLYGNYSGLASSDENGRLSPNMTRSFDAPWMFCDAQGNPVEGRLATDRPHSLKAAFAQMWRSRLGSTTLGGTAFALSGAPVTTEVEVNGLGLVSFVNGRGDMGRMPPISELALLVSHTIPLARGHESRALRFEITANNVLNQDAVTNVYSRYNHSSDGFISTPTRSDALRGFAYRVLMTQQGVRIDPRYGMASAYQRPRDFRFGVHASF